MAERFRRSSSVSCTILITTLALSINGNDVMTHVHTSTFLVQSLLKNEIQFLEELNKYVTAVEKHAKQTREYISTVVVEMIGWITKTSSSK